MIKLIWAMDGNRLIGKDNKLPWKLKLDLKHFSKTTLNQTILMGRTTFENLPGLLPNRKIIVLTRNKNLYSENKNIVFKNNLLSVINSYKCNKNKDIYVCGGVNIYKQTLPYADELIISEIKKTYIGDAYFPKFDLSKFELIKKIEYIDFDVKYYKRKNK